MSTRSSPLPITRNIPAHQNKQGNLSPVSMHNKHINCLFLLFLLISSRCSLPANGNDPYNFNFVPDKEFKRSTSAPQALARDSAQPICFFRLVERVQPPSREKRDVAGRRYSDRYHFSSRTRSARCPCRHGRRPRFADRSA